MAVQIKYTTILRDFKGRFKRATWFAERIPSQEYMILTPSSNDDDGWDVDDNIESIVTIWSDDAEKIATEFWFNFP